ncbi:MAG TPA: glycosyl hydrolase family 65 protein [Propionibacteriaceae bacterium]|nr:glycosyl hydrolase family 65 protein [Propionibacteriaceae bacterium]
MNHDPRGVPLDPVDRIRFPVDPWALVETEPSRDDLGTTETLFALGNGYLGMRANPEEGRDSFAHGTFINGFHETWPIHHAEEAFGFAKVGQTIVNVPDAKTMKIYIDDEPLLLTVADLHHYRRTLDFREGELRREVVWRTPSGKRVSIRSRRMVSFTERHLALMTLEITMLEGDAPIVVSSQVLNRQDGIDEYAQKARVSEEFDPRKASRFAARVLEPRGDWHSERRMILGYQTAHSGMTLAVAVDHTIETDNEVEELISTEPDIGKKVYRVQAHQGQPIVINKAVAYHNSRGVAVRELFDRCRRTLDRVRQFGFEHYREAQRTWLDDWWAGCDVRIEGHPHLQQAVRWNLFQLAQASARADQLGIAAKGVTGSGYEGHYFWDTEAYVIPFLSHTHPGLARNALRFRVTMLPKARERAREVAQLGALFPWRTINGDEASAYYAAGTAQYHINADISYALMNYYAATGDSSFMFREGVDVLIETARLWADLGFWRTDSSGGRSFHIHGVTGPDEYTTVVNNNLFTNVMARANLWSAARVLRDMAEHDPDADARVRTRLRVTDAEVEEWTACADAMVIPYDEVLRVHPQDEHFLERELWDLENTPAEMRPLLLHYHPLVIYRFQVLKQADVVLALFLQGDQFDQVAKRRDFDYYDPITTGDSTLSALVQAIMAAEVGYQEMALSYFHLGLFVDLADLHDNTADGVHIASAAGVWNALVHGFGGMRDYGGHLTFDPRLPQEWPSLSFRLRSHGTLLDVRLEAGRMVFTVVAGGELSVGVRGREVVVAPGEPVEVPLAGQGPVLRSLEGHHPVIGDLRADGTMITAEVPEPSAPLDEGPPRLVQEPIRPSPATT